mgnify:CR=1 FL=1|jgi:hypothetical protein
MQTSNSHVVLAFLVRKFALPGKRRLLNEKAFGFRVAVVNFGSDT